MALQDVLYEVFLFLEVTGTNTGLTVQHKHDVYSRVTGSCKETRPQSNHFMDIISVTVIVVKSKFTFISDFKNLRKLVFFLVILKKINN